MLMAIGQVCPMALILPQLYPVSARKAARKRAASFKVISIEEVTICDAQMYFEEAPDACGVRGQLFKRVHSPCPNGAREGLTTKPLECLRYSHHVPDAGVLHIEPRLKLHISHWHNLSFTFPRANVTTLRADAQASTCPCT